MHRVSDLLEVLCMASQCLLSQSLHVHCDLSLGDHMPSTEALKVAVQEAIDRRGQELIEVATTILHHPEPGFR